MRLSYVFLVLIGVVIWAITSEAADFRDAKGNIWMDSNTLINGKLVSEYFTERIELAELACRNMAGRLPEKSEFDGAKFELLKHFPSRLQNRYFWSNTPAEPSVRGVETRYVFEGDTGSTEETVPVGFTDFSGYVFCISLFR